MTLTFASFLFFIFSTVGLTNIIVESNIFSPIRNLLKKILPTKIYELFECHQCTGTWCGALCGFILFPVNLWVILLCGFSGSFAATMSFMFSEYLISKTEIAWNEEETETN
jgi:hypothetical protein